MGAERKVHSCHDRRMRCPARVLGKPGAAGPRVLHLPVHGRRCRLPLHSTDSLPYLFSAIDPMVHCQQWFLFPGNSHQIDQE